MTEEVPATPGWVEERLDQLFAGLPPETHPARRAYSSCLAGQKAPAAPSDLLGAEFASCRSALRRALLTAGVARDVLDRLGQGLEALEAELGAES